MSRFGKQFKLKEASCFISGVSLELVKLWVENKNPFLCVKDVSSDYAYYVLPNMDCMILCNKFLTPLYDSPVREKSTSEPTLEGKVMCNKFVLKKGITKLKCSGIDCTIWNKKGAVFTLIEYLDFDIPYYRFPNGDEYWEYRDQFVPAPEETQADMVNHPPHYLQLGMEVKEIIKHVLLRTYGEEAYKAYCLGNELKYRLRAGDKGDPVEDLKKAGFYRRERNENKD